MEVIFEINIFDIVVLKLSRRIDHRNSLQYLVPKSSLLLRSTCNNYMKVRTINLFSSICKLTLTLVV